jgi:hypothetical protein
MVGSCAWDSILVDVEASLDCYLRREPSALLADVRVRTHRRRGGFEASSRRIRSYFAPKKSSQK